MNLGMDALGNGDCISWTNFYAASAGNTFLDTDNCFSSCHDKAPFCFLSIIQGEEELFGDEVTQMADDHI